MTKKLRPLSSEKICEYYTIVENLIRLKILCAKHKVLRPLGRGFKPMIRQSLALRDHKGNRHLDVLR